MYSLKDSYDSRLVGSVSRRLQVLTDASIWSANRSFGFGEKPRGGSLSAPVKKINMSLKATCRSSSVKAVQSIIIMQAD